MAKPEKAPAKQKDSRNWISNKAREAPPVLTTETVKISLPANQENNYVEFSNLGLGINPPASPNPEPEGKSMSWSIFSRPKNSS
jgi:hypothetical protein